ncbi:MAG: DNA damage-inducible protein DinB [Alphaproteobacteria bacterium]|nr:MAG: DNA damage-inducible protein DinB [Alphaproteobacteria bacterium]
MSRELDTLRWQFDLALRLAAHHMPALTDEACLWLPAPGAWTVRRGEDGRWRPDWSDQEPDPAPAVSIGWLTWHLLWWSTGFVDALEGAPPTAREDAFWPGAAAHVRVGFDDVAARWSRQFATLSDAALERPFAHPWPEPRPLRIALAWANAELMKNVAEIGALRHLYEARH